MNLKKTEKVFFESIPKLIQMNKLLYDDRVSNQSNLFEADHSSNEKLVISNSNKWTKRTFKRRI